MASHGYLRSLATPPIALPPVRVKLVFLDELETFVTRHRGFSSCWYLIPRTAKLVGDLLHEIAEEFELLARCPQGLEMVLDGFHVLANQEIAMVRDNDTLALQCASFVERPVSRSTERTRKKAKRSESVGSVGEDAKLRVKKAKVNGGAAAVVKVPKRMRRAVQPPASSSSDDSSDEDEKVSKPAATRSSQKSNATSDSTSSSDDSSSSSSSEDEQKAPPTPKQRAFKAIVKETVREMNQEIVKVRSSDSSDSSSSSSDSDSDVAVPAKKPVTKGAKPVASEDKQPTNEGDATKGTRRRRRPRRRTKGGEAATPATGPITTAATATTSKNTPPAVLSVTSQAQAPKEIRPLRIRGVPPPSKQVGKLHMRFDTANKPPVLPPPGAEREVSADLHKYGPASVKPRSKSSDGNGGAQTEEVATSTKKKQSKEMWKRPYEIISSIHDETPTGDTSTTTTSKPTLDALLASFPSKPTTAVELLTPSGFHVDDIVAYKTLTLCMETWQPIVSEWKCAKVLGVQDTDQAVVLQPHNWILPATTNGTLSWEAIAPSESDEAELAIATGEVSELRYLHGPSRDHVAKTA